MQFTALGEWSRAVNRIVPFGHALTITYCSSVCVCGGGGEFLASFKDIHDFVQVEVL